MLTSRRQWLATLSTAGAVCTMTAPARAASTAAPFRYCFNTATIRGQKLALEQEIDTAGKAGYDAFEPWIDKIEQHVKAGKPLSDARKRITDYGMTVESAIGFPAWIVDDETQRRKGLDDAKRAMDLLSQLGGKRLAAPPVGATDKTNIDLRQATDRYRQLLELGDQMGIVPQVEVWGFSKTLSHLGEAALVAIEAQHPKACVLADVYHLYKGGSGFAGLKLLAAAGLQVFHMNDYPNLHRAKIADKDRVYPGDGVAPLKEVLQTLQGLRFKGVLSLELFNPEYYKQDPFEVAKTGLAKMKAVVQAAVG
jgi:2-keto-myo-inositol isomerase